MEISEIDLGFLWDEFPVIFDAPNPYEIRWNAEINKFDQFIREESLDKVLEAVVIAFKDIYPRPLFLYLALSTGFYSKVIEEGEYAGLNQTDILRDDISKYRDKTYKDSEGLEFIVEILLEYSSTTNAVDYVERGLQGKSYIKLIQDNYTVFSVQNSPILEITANSNKFHLKLDNERVVFRAG